MKASVLAWWTALLGFRPVLPTQLAGARRWIVVDVESSGLNATRDRLLAVAALAVHFDESFRNPQIAFGDAFEVNIRQEEAYTHHPDKANIVIHGIGVGAQRAGLCAAKALTAWEDYIAQAPIVAYNSSFDRQLLDRASRSALGRTLPNAWLDLEPIAALAHHDPRRRPLDHWLDRHGIECLARHQAAADALATAELLLCLWPTVRAHVDGRFPSVADWAESHRFMPGRHGSR